MDPRIEARLSTDVVELRADEPVDDARERLGSGGFGAVVEPTGKLAGLVTRDDLDAPGVSEVGSLLLPGVPMPPTLVIGRLADPATIAGPDLGELIERGARGAIVLGDEGVLGVLPADALRDLLGEHAGHIEIDFSADIDALLAGEGMNTHFVSAKPDTGLGGDIDPNGTRMLLINCGICSYQNRMRSIDYNALPDCQNPNWRTHKLKP